MDLTRGLKRKLRVASIERGPHGSSYPAFAYGGNQPVLCSAATPLPQLKKKSNSTACHLAREGCARGRWRAGRARPEESQGGLLSKPLPEGAKREKLAGKVLHYVYGKVSGVEYNCYDGHW